MFEFLHFGRFFPFFKKIGFLGILGPPYCGIGATIRIGREMLCLPYAGFFHSISYPSLGLSIFRAEIFGLLSPSLPLIC